MSASSRTIRQSSGSLPASRNHTTRQYMDGTPYSRLLPQSEKFTESPRILPESRIPATRQSIDRVAHRTLLRGGKKLRRSLEVIFQSGLPQARERKAWRPIAWCSFLTGKHEQALRYYENILSNVPSALDYMNAGHVELALKHTRRALELYRQSISIDNNDTQSFVNNFKQDIPELVRAGVAENDIPILLDQLLYQIS